MSEIKHFWHLGQQGQQSLKEYEQQIALEQEACERKMLVYKGKLILPEDYPCECVKEEAEDCFEQREADEDDSLTEKEREEEYCDCPCHTYAQGW